MERERPISKVTGARQAPDRIRVEMILWTRDPRHRLAGPSIGLISNESKETLAIAIFPELE